MPFWHMKQVQKPYVSMKVRNENLKRINVIITWDHSEILMK